MDDRLSAYDILCLRAQNPGLLTLSGTNTWVVGRNPAYVVDPGPTLDAHLSELLVAIRARGGLGGVVLTHDHPDHAQAVATLLERMPAPLAGGRGDVDVQLLDGARFGPFQALHTPGHAPDHYALIAGRACFTGDAVLGAGSVFIAPDPGALAGYLDGLRRLRTRAPALDVLCPGHGPPIWEPVAKLEDYLEHRLDRERRVVAALDAGERSAEGLVATAWSEVPAALRPIATATLVAHLDKLADEGRLPPDVQRPTW
jgi:glyoxylase-like metal-dependent hydrolase (beta-lactamase superfamily II)